MQLVSTSFIPKSKLLGVSCGILISYFAAILLSIPCYFLNGRVAITYFLAICFCIPVSIGVITTVMLGYHKQSSVVISLLYSQLTLIISYFALMMTTKPSLGYAGALLFMCLPIFMIFAAIGTMIGCEWLLRMGKLRID